MTSESSLVLLICADREGAERLAVVIQALGHRVVAAPFGPTALSRAADARLIVVDRVEGPVDGAGAVGRIKGTPTLADIPLLAVAQTDHVDERVRLLEAGADDVMARPYEPEELEARVDGLLVRVSRYLVPFDESTAAESVSAGPRLITFFSPKGGVGTTTLAVNVAVATASRRQQSVALVDLDLQWGQVATQLNMTPRSSVLELARDAAALDDRELVRSYAEKHVSGLAVYPAPRRPDQAVMLVADHVTRLLEALKDAYDVVVVDAGSVFDERSLIVFENADRLVLVVTPEIPAVRAVHALLEVLAELGGPIERHFFVLNHLFSADMLRLDDIERSLQATMQAEVRYDPVAYLKAANEGVPVVAATLNRGPTAERLELVADQILGEVPVVTRPPEVERVKPRLDISSLLRRGRGMMPGQGVEP